MNLSALIGDYQICASRLFAAIEAEDLAVIRELDIRMSWLRDTIRDFPAISETDRHRQIEFFVDLLSDTTDQNRDVPPLSDLRVVIDRNITGFARARTPPLHDQAEAIASQLAHNNLPDEHAVAAIENATGDTESMRGGAYDTSPVPITREPPSVRMRSRSEPLPGGSSHSSTPAVPLHPRPSTSPVSIFSTRASFRGKPMM